MFTKTRRTSPLDSRDIEIRNPGQVVQLSGDWKVPKGFVLVGFICQLLATTAIAPGFRLPVDMANYRVTRTTALDMSVSQANQTVFGNSGVPHLLPYSDENNPGAFWDIPDETEVLSQIIPRIKIFTTDGRYKSEFDPGIITAALQAARSQPTPASRRAIFTASSRNGSTGNYLWANTNVHVRQFPDAIGRCLTTFPIIFGPLEDSSGVESMSYFDPTLLDDDKNLKIEILTGSGEIKYPSTRISATSSSADMSGYAQTFGQENDPAYFRWFGTDAPLLLRITPMVCAAENFPAAMAKRAVGAAASDNLAYAWFLQEVIASQPTSVMLSEMFMTDMLISEIYNIGGAYQLRGSYLGQEQRTSTRAMNPYTSRRGPRFFPEGWTGHRPVNQLEILNLDGDKRDLLSLYTDPGYERSGPVRIDMDAFTRMGSASIAPGEFRNFALDKRSNLVLPTAPLGLNVEQRIVVNLGGYVKI